MSFQFSTHPTAHPIRKVISDNYGLLLDEKHLEAVPFIDHLVFHNQNDLYFGKRSEGELEKLYSGLLAQKQAYEQFVERKERRALYDIYACFQPFNEAIKAFFPFIKILKKRLQPDDAILALWDRSGWMASLLAGLFPEQRIILTWEGDNSLLGYKGFDFWFKEEDRISIVFCDLNKPLPFADNSIALSVGYDVFHNFDQSLLLKELLRVVRDEEAIIFPHVHLTNSEPDPYFDRGCKQMHGLEYDAFFRKLTEASNRTGYIFPEPKMFWLNDVVKSKDIPLVSEPDMKEHYNALIAILPQSWQNQKLEAFGLLDLENVEEARILINPLLDINLHQQIVKVDRNFLESRVGYLLDRHPIYVKRIARADQYPLSETACKMLYWAKRCLDLRTIADKILCPIQDLIPICKELEDRGVVQLLPLSENGLRLQNFVGTQHYAVPYREQNLQRLWQKAKARYGEATLIYSKADESELTYNECYEIMESIMARLQAQGLGKGDRITIFSPVHSEAMLCYWACMQIGIGVAFANYESSFSDLKHIVTLTGSKILFCSVQNYAVAQQATDLTTVIVWDEVEAEERAFPGNCFSDWLGEIEEQPIPVQVEHTDEAVILFTSGSTGVPKGVQLSHGHLCRSGRLITETFGWEKEDRFLAYHGFDSMSMLRNACIAPLWVGSSVIIPIFESFQHALGVAESIFSYKASLFTANPALLRRLVKFSKRIGSQLSSLRYVMCTGSNLSSQLRADFQKNFKLPVINYYGLTETTGIFISESPERHNSDSGVLGFPVTGICQIVDAQGRLVPAGKEGELRVYSENVMQAYLAQPDATSSVLREGWFYTGDIAKYREDGSVQWLGRKRNIIKTSSDTIIYIREIEEFVLQHPKVEAVAVCPYQKDETEHIAVFIVSSEQADNHQKMIQELTHQIKSELGIRKVPSIFRIKASLPYASNGKIQKNKLLNEI